MICPECKVENTVCVDTRQKKGYRKRRYWCNHCGYRFNTVEATELNGDALKAYSKITNPKLFKKLIYSAYQKIFGKDDSQ